MFNDLFKKKAVKMAENGANELLKTKVAEVIATSTSEKWPFPKTFTALKTVGVSKYEVGVADSKATYYIKDIHFSLDLPIKHAQYQIAEKFDGAKVKEIIAEHNAKKTSYADFMKAVAGAGVKSYIVDMAAKTCTYTSGRPQENVVEKVPA